GEATAVWEVVVGELCVWWWELWVESMGGRRAGPLVDG
ncbi:MAG: hypothetical protein ACI91B_004506, partial [Planctomycetota bacterium]